MNEKSGAGRPDVRSQLPPASECAPRVAHEIVCLRTKSNKKEKQGKHNE
jgi:hypothetical protein